MLDIMNRGHTIREVIEATELARKWGFRVNIDIIFGLPGESQKDIKETINFCKILVDMGAKIHAHTFIPLPGTPLENTPSGKIDPFLFEFINTLISKGALFGQWQRQQSYLIP